jgi:nucleoside phosphorylase
MSEGEGEKRQTFAVQTVDGRGRPFGGSDIELELHIDGVRRQTVGKKTSKSVTFKFPAGHKTRILVRILGFAPQDIEVGSSATHHEFKFKGGGEPIVLIVATKACEAAAVWAVCDHYGEPIGPANDPNIYRVGTLVTGTGKTPRKILMVTSGMGNQAAGAVTVQGLNSFPGIEHILLVGIAGACPNPAKPADHIRLGDIVVADHRGIVQYDNIKATATSVEYRGQPQKPAARMLQAASSLDTEAELGKRPWEAWIAHGLKNYPGAARPDEASDVLHDGAAVVQHPADSKRRPGQSRVHRGAIASADTLQKNPAQRDMLRDKWDVRAIEMEGSGFQNAAWMLGKDVMVIRGICDYCDAYKNDDWQPYASMVAAAYARAMIETLPNEWFP